MTRDKAESRKNRTAGAIATAMYLALWVLLMLFVTCSSRDRDDDSEGFMINFGDSETGMGAEDLRTSVETAPTPTRPQTSVPKPENIATQDREPAPAIVPPSEKPKPTEQPTVTETPQEAEPSPVVEKPREVDQRALFPGASDSNAQSEGVNPGPGNQGNLAGTTEGSHEGTGTGNNGDRWNLSGRSLIGKLPEPDYSVKEEGRVVIEIRVDQQGKVISTAFVSRGSTTTNSVLVAAAGKAAARARFNVDENAPFPQVGTITYNFEIKRD